MEENKLKTIEGELEAPADFTSPDVLYRDLVASIRKSHPSDDVFSVPAQQVIEFFDGIIAYEHDPDQSDPCVHETLLSYV